MTVERKGPISEEDYQALKVQKRLKGVEADFRKTLAQFMGKNKVKVTGINFRWKNIDIEGVILPDDFTIKINTKARV